MGKFTILIVVSTHILCCYLICIIPLVNQVLKQKAHANFLEWIPSSVFLFGAAIGAEITHFTFKAL